MKVKLEMKNGKTRGFHPQVAKVLVARGVGKEMGYMTREMRAIDVGQVEQVSYSDKEIVQAFPAWKSDDPESMKAELDRRGIKYHHRAGVAKLRELLEG